MTTKLETDSANNQITGAWCMKMRTFVKYIYIAEYYLKKLSKFQSLINEVFE